MIGCISSTYLTSNIIRINFKGLGFWGFGVLGLSAAVGTYGMSGPRYQYAWSVFAFTTGIILADALQGTEQIEILAFERSGEVAIGLLIVFLADEIFWPVRSGDQLRAGLAQRCRWIRRAIGHPFDAIAVPARCGCEVVTAAVVAAHPTADPDRPAAQ